MTAREELKALYDEHGEVTAALVVEAARPRSSALHGYLTWDRDKAAAKCRLIEAADLIRRFDVVYREGSEDRESVRGREWINVAPDDGPASYKHVTDVAEDEFMRTLDLRRMERELAAFKRRFGHRAEFYAAVAALLQQEAS